MSLHRLLQQHKRAYRYPSYHNSYHPLHSHFFQKIEPFIHSTFFVQGPMPVMNKNVEIMFGTEDGSQQKHYVRYLLVAYLSVTHCLDVQEIRQILTAHSHHFAPKRYLASFRLFVSNIQWQIKIHTLRSRKRLEGSVKKQKHTVSQFCNITSNNNENNIEE